MCGASVRQGILSLRSAYEKLWILGWKSGYESGKNWHKKRVKNVLKNGQKRGKIYSISRHPEAKPKDPVMPRITSFSETIGFFVSLTLHSEWRCFFPSSHGALHRQGIFRILKIWRYAKTRFLDELTHRTLRGMIINNVKFSDKKYQNLKKIF